MEFAVIPIAQRAQRKMKFLAVLCGFGLCFLISKSDGAVWISGESGVHSDHLGSCWSQSLNREFSVGEEFADPTKCELIRCGPNYRFSRRV